MLLSDGMLVAGAGLAEFGLPAALIWSVKASERWRPKAVVVLGALTPLFLIYATACFYSIFVSGLNKTDLVYLLAALPVGFVFYAATVLLGAAAAFIRKPAGLWARFGLGMTVAPLACGSIVLLTR
ncbi:hypothetical protein ABIC75_003665 [Dyella japonica]|uniref:Uncharacterized protein n=1 Tax=Dyella japonica TaxID=231455 RepID=A0ABV2JZB8_9GAMM